MVIEEWEMNCPGGKVVYSSGKVVPHSGMSRDRPEPQEVLGPGGLGLG